MCNWRPRKILEFWLLLLLLLLHLENSSHDDCADWCLVSSHQVSAKSAKYCRLWTDLKISKCASYSTPWGKSKNPARSDCANCCLVSSFQVSAQSHKNWGLWIDLNIARGAKVWIFQLFELWWSQFNYFRLNVFVFEFDPESNIKRLTFDSNLVWNENIYSHGPTQLIRTVDD